MKRSESLILLLLTFAALLVSGYHPWAEDAEIYLPGVEKLLHPQLFPFNAQFFATHASYTWFPNLIAGSVTLTHLPLAVALLLWHLLCIFLFLLACWHLSGKCFPHKIARWAGVSLVAALLTLPVAGTSLYILDQYVNPRNLAPFAMIVAIARILDRKFAQAGLFLALATAIHPFMAVFATSYCVLLALVQKFVSDTPHSLAFFPFGFTVNPPSAAYHHIALRHRDHYLTHWHWYEWLGAVAPIAILGSMARMARSRELRNLELLCRTLMLYEFVYLPLAVVLSIPARFEVLARVQPMRCLHLLYILMFLFAGGLLGEYVLKKRVWRWLALFVPLCAGMLAAQSGLFPASAHVEWPGVAPKNPWVQAFQWTRNHTPVDAIFALGPNYMNLPNEDHQGFRAVAQRSRLADSRDADAASMFPALADEWFRQTEAQRGWESFGLEEFRRLRATYGATWVIVQQPGVQGLDCPYQNEAVRVCRLN